MSASLETNFHWIELRSKKRTYADAVHSSPPLSDANRVPLGSSHFHRPSVSSRLNYDDLCRKVLQSDHFRFNAKNTQTRKSSVNLDLNSNLNPTPSVNSHGPLPNFRLQSMKPNGPPCTCCLSHKHGRPMCRNCVRCTSCFRLGHVALHCRFLPRFPSLHLSSSLPSFPIPVNSGLSNTWFSSQSSLTAGPSGSNPLCFLM